MSVCVLNSGPRTIASRTRLLVSTALFGAAAFASSGATAQVQPTNGVVVGGMATIDQSNATQTVVDLNNTNSAINWDSFNVGANEAIRFITSNKSTDFSVLNRVVMANPSTIAGTIDAGNDGGRNIAVWLINPTGVMFSNGASFSGGSLVLSTADIAATDFLAAAGSTNSFALAGAPSTSGITLAVGSVINSDRGFAAIGQSVDASGVINNFSGEVALVAAQDVTLGFAPGSPIAVNVTAGTVMGSAGVDANGRIIAQSIKLAGSSGSTVMSDLLNIGSGAELVATASNGRIVLASATEAGGDPNRVMVTDAGGQGGIVINGALTANGVFGVIDLTAANGVNYVTGGAIKVNSLVANAGNAALQSNNSNVTLGRATTGTGSLFIDVPNGTAAVTGAVNSGGAFNVAARGVVLGGTAAVEQMARGGISLTAGVQGVTTAAGAGSVTLTSNSDMDNVGGGTTNITTTGGGEIDFANGSILRSRSMGGLASAVSLNSSAAARFGTVDADGLSITASSVTARGDITVRNPLSISSTGTTSLRDVMVTGPSAGASLTSDGAFTADRITADGAVSIIGSSIDLLGATANGGDVQLTATSGNVNLGTATARDNVFVNASGNAAVTANVTAGAAFNVTAANITLGRASAFALQQAGTSVGLQLSPGGGTVAGLGALQLVSNSAGNTGGFTSIGTGNGNVEFGADTLLRSSGIGTPNSGVLISNGTGSVRVGAVTADVLSTSATSASITADAAITTVNSLNLSATGAVTLQSVETTGTGSNLTVDAGGALDAFDLKAAGQVTVDAGTLDIDFVNAVAGAVDLETNAGVLRVGSVTAGGAASLTKAGGLGDLIVTGAVRAGQAPASFGTITISSDRSARLGSGSFASGLFSATGDVSVSAINDITGTDAGGGSFNRLWSSTGPSGDTSIMSSGNGLALLGNVSAQRNLTVQAGQIDALSGIPIEAIGGALRLTATTGDLNVTDARGRTGVLLESLPGNVTMGTVSSTAGSVTATANLGSVTSGNATAFGSLNYVGQTVALSGTQTAGGKIDVISSSGPITAMPGTLIRSNSDSVGSEAIVFDATGGDVMLGGATLNAGDSSDPSLIGIRLGAGANNVTLGTVDALSIVSVGIDHTSFDTGLGGVAGTVTLGDVTSRNTLNIAAAGTITANTINVTRPGQALMLNATGAASNVVLNGNIAATGAVILTAGNTVTGTSATGGSADITANAGDVVFGTVATTAGLGQLRAIAGNVRVDSLTTTGGDAVLLAGGDVTGRLVGTRANVTANDAGRDVRVAIGGTANLDQVRAGRDFNGTAGAFDIVDLATSNGAIALSASTGDISVLRGSAGTTANLSSNAATADVRIGETLIAGTASGSTGNITLNSARDILVADFNPASPGTGFVRSVTGSITATAARDVKGSGASTRPSDRGFDTVSAGGDLTISGSGDIRADELTAGGNLSASTVDGSLTGTGAGGGTTGTNVQGTAFFAQTGGQGVSINGGSAGLIQAREIRAGGDVNLGAGGIAVGTIETTGGTVRLNTAAGAPADPADYYVGLLTSPGNLAITLGGPSAAIASITNGLVFDPAFDQADLSAGTGSITISVSKVAQLGTTASQTDTTIMSGSAGVANATSRAGALNIGANIGTLALDTGSALTTATLAKTGGAGDLAVRTSLTSGQNATISTSTNAQIATATAATGTLQVAVTGALTGVMGGRAALEATAGNVITNSASALLGLVTSGTSSSLTTSGLLDVTTVMAGTNATLTGGTVLAGAVTATTGDLLVDATAGNATLGTGNAGGTGTVQATGDANVTTSLTATNQARVSAGPAGTATVASVTSNAANVIVNGGSVNVALADAATSLALSATNGDLILGDGDAGTTATLTKTGTPNGELSILTELTSGQGATISSSTNARILTATAATGTLDVSADGEITGLMGARANLEATAGNIVLDAGTTALLGTITSGTSTDLTAGTLLDVTSVVAGTDATLTGGTVVAGSVMAGTGNVNVIGSSVDLANANAVAALNVTATTGDLNLGVGQAGTLATLITNVGDVFVNTSVTGGTGVMVDAASDARIVLATATTGNLGVTAGGEITGLAAATAIDDVLRVQTLTDGGTSTLLAQTGDVRIGQIVNNGAGIDVDATAGSVTGLSTTDISAMGGAQLLALTGNVTTMSGGRTAIANVDATNVSVTAERASIVSATARNALTATAANALSVETATVANGATLTTTAGSATIVPLTSTNFIFDTAAGQANLTANNGAIAVDAGSVAQLGSVTAATNIDITAAAAAVSSATAMAGALNITATTGGLYLDVGSARTDATLVKRMGSIGTADDEIDVVTSLTVGGTARLDSDTHVRATLVDAGGSIAARSGAGDVTATTLVADEDVAIKSGRDTLLTTTRAGDDVELVVGRNLETTSVTTTGMGPGTTRIDLNSPTLGRAAVVADKSNILAKVAGYATILTTANANATLAVDVTGNFMATGAATLVAGEDIAVRTGGFALIDDARASDDIDISSVGLVLLTRAESTGGGADDRRVSFGAALPTFANTDNLAQSNIVISANAGVGVTTAIAKATFAGRSGDAFSGVSIVAGEDVAVSSVRNANLDNVIAGDDIEVATDAVATISAGSAGGSGADNRRVTFSATGPVLTNAETASGRNVIVDARERVILGSDFTATMPEIRADASIAVLSGGRIDASNLRAGEDIALDAVGQIAIGIASAGDDIVALSDSGILVRDSAMALGTGPNARSVNFARGTNGIANGGVAFATTDTLGMGGVSLTTTGSTSDIEIGTLLESRGDTRLTSSRDVRVNTVRSTNGSIIGNATRDFTGLAMASAFGPGTGLRVGTLNDGGATAVTADTGDIRIGSITTTGGNIGVTATQGSVTGLLAANDVPAGSGAVLSANGGVSLTVGGRTALTSATAGGAIGIGSGTISIGNANAGSTLALTATGDALSLDTGIAGSGATLRTQSGTSTAIGLTDAASAPDRLTDQFGSANLAANGMDRSITVQVANATKGAQLGMVSATRDVTVNAGAIAAISVTAGAGTAATTGAINLAAANGALYLGTGSARTTATLTKRDGDMDGLLAAQTDRDELRVRTSLTAGGNVAIDTATSNRLANVTSTSGSIMVNSVAQTTGIGAGTAPSSDITHGRANLTANGAGQDVTVTSGNLSQLGTVSAGRNVSITAGNTTMRGGAPVNGAIDATAITAGTGAIVLTARAVTPVAGSIEDGDIIVGTGTAGTSATISNTATGGTLGDVIVNQNLSAGGNIAITSAANARLAGDDATRRIVSTTGKIDVNANGSVTGIAGGGTGGTEAGFGRANLVANAAGQDVTITSGAVTQAMIVSAGRNVDVRAGSMALGNGAIDVTTASAGTGSLLLLAQATNPGSDMVRDGDIVLGTGTAGTTATITNTSGIGVPGSTLAAALAGNAGNITVANSLTASQLVTVNAANGATLGATTSQTANVFIQSNQIALNGAVTANGTASEVRLVNRVDTGATRVNGTVLGNGGAANQFVLDNAEMGRLNANRVVIETAQAGNDIQDVSLTSTGVDLNANTGRNRFEVLAVSPNPTSGLNPTIFLNGTLNGGTTARTIQIGGSGGAFGVAETAAPSVTSGGLSGRIVAVVTGTGGGRILAPAANVELRAQRLLFGTEALRAEAIGLTPTQIANDFVANANSLLFDARGAFETNDASQVFLRANTLTVRYRDFALFQNSAPRGLNAGIVLGDTMATGTRLTLFSTGGFPSDNAFAFFGTINNLTGRSVGLQSDMIIQFAEVGGTPQRVNQNQSRLNGCVLGAPDRGCLTTESPVPTLKLFDERQILLLSAGVETPLDFDPLVSANNEALFVDFGGFAIDPASDDDCPRGRDGACVKPEGTQ